MCVYICVGVIVGGCCVHIQIFCLNPIWGKFNNKITKEKKKGRKENTFRDNHLSAASISRYASLTKLYIHPVLIK